MSVGFLDTQEVRSSSLLGPTPQPPWLLGGFCHVSWKLTGAISDGILRHL